MGFALPRNLWRERAPDNDPPGVIPAKLPRAIDQIGWAFTWGCVGFLLYFTWSAAGDKAVALEINQFLWWQNIGLKLWLPLVVPYTIISVAVPILVKFGLPMFMEFDGKKPRQAWPKWWSAVLVVGGSLVIIAGSFVVQNDARLEQNRTGAVQVQQAAANKAAVDAEIDELRSQLRVLTEDGQARPTIEGKAAREGAAGWPVKVAEAESQFKAGQPVDVNRIRRAQSAAIAADTLRDKITTKIGQKAAMPTEAAVADRVVKEGDSATAVVDFVKQWRSLLLALIADLGALFCTWLAMRLTDIRAQQLADWNAVHNAPVSEAGVDLRITDGTDQWQPVPNETTYDENGDELIPVRRRKEVHYRRKAKKKDDAQAPLNASDSRAPVANQVVSEPRELESEAPLEVVREAYDSSFEGRDGADEPLVSGNENPSPDAHLQLLEVEETHSGLPDESPERMAEYVRDGEVLDALGERGTEASLTGDDAGGDDQLNAPLEAPDEQITWDDEGEQAEPQEPEDHDQNPAETPLPNGEGVLVKAAE